MDEVGLDTLLLSGECDIQWGSRGSSTVHRTIELHGNHILYCFVEPKNSMAKHIREKVYIEGCHVVDGGSHSGEKERLQLFLTNQDYAEAVNLVGNRTAYLFPKEGKEVATRSGSVGSSMTDLPSADYVVQIYLTDKMFKWRLLQAIQRGSLAYPQLFPESPTSPALTGSLHSKSSPRGFLSPAPPPAPSVPNHFETRVLGQSVRAAPPKSAALEHEVVQLADVLREYDAIQKRRADEAAAAATAVTTITASAAQEDRRGSGNSTANSLSTSMAEAEQRVSERVEELCFPATLVATTGTTIPTTTTADTAASTTMEAANDAAPLRLRQSPLYEACIATNPANQRCADCDAVFPSWCLLQPFGAIVCIECIGVHRRLWSNRCRGAELDLWPEADRDYMQHRGNAVVNGELEYCVAFPSDSVEATLCTDPPVKPVTSFSTSEVRAAYIQWKYEEQLFTARRHPTVTEPVPPRPDPAGLGHARLAQTGVAVGEGEGGRISDMSFGSPVQLQQRAFLRDEGPPRYAGLLDVIVKELVGPEAMPGALCVLTNGFQTLRTHGGRQLLHMRNSTAWDEHLQVGVEGTGRKPIYCSIYRANGELLATTEVWMKEEVFLAESSCMFAASLTWNQLQKKSSQRNPAEEWQVTFLTSYRPLL